MTLVSIDALLPSSADAGSMVRAQNARPIPRSEAHTSVTANGQAVRFCCGDDGRLVAMAADVWFTLYTVLEFPLKNDAFETSTNRAS